MTKPILNIKHRSVGKRKGVGNAFHPTKVSKSRKGRWNSGTIPTEYKEISTRLKLHGLQKAGPSNKTSKTS